MRVTLTPTIKRQITKDWASCFPEMGVYKTMELLRRVGPLLIGIGLERDSGNDSYRPTFHVHNLARPMGSITLTLSQRLRTVHTGADETIPARWHEEKFRDAAARLAQQAPLPFAGDVSLDDVLRVYRNRLHEPEGRFDKFIFEDMALIYSWARLREQAERIAIEGRSAIETWPEYVRHKIGNLNDWENKLLGQVSNPEEVRAVVQREIEALGVQDIPYRDLIV